MYKSKVPRFLAHPVYKKLTGIQISLCTYRKQKIGDNKLKSNRKKQKTGLYASLCALF